MNVEIFKISPCDQMTNNMIEVEVTIGGVGSGIKVFVKLEKKDYTLSELRRLATEKAFEAIRRAAEEAPPL